MQLDYIDCLQGSEEWIKARLGMVTCSGLKHVLAKGEGKTRTKYMMQLAGEILTQKPAYAFKNDHMERGQEEESEARTVLSLRLGRQISTVGFIKNHDLRLGCSPDGLISNNEGCEFKSALPDVQIERYKLTDIPSEFRVQIEGSLVATGRKSWHFLSYSPFLPPIYFKASITQQREDEIKGALEQFNEELDQMVKDIKARY